MKGKKTWSLKAFRQGFPGGSDVKEYACKAGDVGSIPGSGRSLEKEMATHSTILAWRMPRTEEPGGYSPGGRKESDTTEQLNSKASVRSERRPLVKEPLSAAI